MPAVIEELFQGRSETLAEKSSAEIPYAVRGASDESQVKAMALAGTPSWYAGMPRKSIEVVERVNATTWKVSVRYETLDVQSGNEPVISFDTGGGSQHITQSIQTRAKYGPAASDKLEGAIGFDGENVAGVDITVPVYSFSETHYLPAVAVTATYRGNLFRLTGTVNADWFRGFQPGECLFLGASGSRKGAEDWEISYKFAAQPNRTDIMVGTIGPITKQGWDYMWVQYADDVDNQKKLLIKKPVAVYVEKVYQAGFFAALGIGS